MAQMTAASSAMPMTTGTNTPATLSAVLEIGISTQKMHARGPMGLEELTSCKYVIYGEGQVR